MNHKVQMVMLAAKKLNVPEWTIVACGQFYQSGHGWKIDIDRKGVDREYGEYQHGNVSRLLEDFCLDYLSGRIPPNLFVNALQKQHEYHPS